MHRFRWTIAVALAALSGACGGGSGSGDTIATPTPPPTDPLGASQTYDVNAAMLALFNGQFAEVHATAMIYGVLFHLKVTPISGTAPSPPAPGSTVPPATYRTSFLGLQLMADGYMDANVIGYQYEGSPTRIVGATRSTPRGTVSFADASEPIVPLPTSATIGQSQQLLRGPIYELDYSAGYDKPPARVPFPGSIARGWRLDPDDADSAYLCLVDEVDDGTDKGVDDYCYSIRPNGQPTGRFRATLTDTDTGERHPFEQAATPAPTPVPPPAPPPTAPSDD